MYNFWKEQIFHCVCHIVNFSVLSKAPTVGFEPTTFGLEVQRASPLRHAGLWFWQKKYRTHDLEKNENITVLTFFFVMELDVEWNFSQSRASVAQLVSAFDC